MVALRHFLRFIDLEERFEKHGFNVKVTYRGSVIFTLSYAIAGWSCLQAKPAKQGRM